MSEIFNKIKKWIKNDQVSSYPEPECKYLVTYNYDNIYKHLEITNPKFIGINVIYYYMHNKYPGCEIIDIEWVIE